MVASQLNSRKRGLGKSGVDIMPWLPKGEISGGCQKGVIKRGRWETPELYRDL